MVPASRLLKVLIEVGTADEKVNHSCSGIFKNVRGEPYAQRNWFSREDFRRGQVCPTMSSGPWSESCQENSF